MKILFTGDIVGKPGREAIYRLLPTLKKEFSLELVIANAENAAGGSGITPSIAEELFSCGVDLLTSGDHIWKRREVLEVIDKEERILRPANYPENTPGRGAVSIISKGKVEVGVINLVGRVFMQAVECPFRVAQREIQALKKKTPIVIVDMHAEATSEKQALARFLDGEVSCVVGTHTHVQTADERILPKGTAYITDLGMTGPHESILGRRIEDVIERFVTQMPVRFEVAEEDVQLQGVVVEINPTTAKAISIERIQRRI